MKRKSLLLVMIVLMVFTGVGKGYVWVRYSPYAFSSNYPSGLVPHYVRYSPYAFSHKHLSGLIDGYSGCFYYPRPYYFPAYDCPRPIIVQPPKTSDCPKVKIIKNPRISTERISMKNDGKWIVYNYLKSKGLDVDIVDGFHSRNQTVSTIFLIRSQGWLIKYQNPKLEKSLEGNPLWEKYKKRWQEKEKKYQAVGWRIAKIVFNK